MESTDIESNKTELISYLNKTNDRTN